MLLQSGSWVGLRGLGGLRRGASAARRAPPASACPLHGRAGGAPWAPSSGLRKQQQQQQRWHASTAAATPAAAAAPSAGPGEAAAGSGAGQHEPPRGRLYLIDTKAQVYRLTHGYGDSAAPSAQQGAAAAGAAGGAPEALGESSIVAHGFVNILLGLFAHKPPPTHMAVVVDAPGANFRNVLYPQYKGQRSEAPPGLKQDVGRILDIVDALGIPVLAVPGVEADDVIGSLAARGAAAGMDVTIVSPDKDFFQLLCPRVRLLRLIKSPKKAARAPGSPFYTLEDFEAEHGLGAAARWADVMALQGDDSDNIPGVRGIGAKTALRLVQAFGSVEGVLADGKWEGVKLNKKQREVLASEDGALAARLAKQLVTVVTDLKQPDVCAPLDSFRLRAPADGGAELQARLDHYRLAWVKQRLMGVVAGWRDAGGAAPL
ncbi:MAG: PIN domain-like protein [Monoraphidium minutum]|nr:MAG: PIN domain-like protein [Monoraphidium minutum]